MKATVNQSCIGCGLCISACPGVFTLADTGVAVGVSFPAPLWDAVQQAAQACPVGAIQVDESPQQP